MKPITVLIIDDSALIRQMFTEMLSSEPDIEVLDTAVDPYDAREKIKRLNPNVVTLDIEMPKMDGLTFLEKIMTLRPMPVIMASTLTQKGASATIRALELGAVDYISKPLGAHTADVLGNLKTELANKIRVAAKANMVNRNKTAPSANTSQVIPFNPPVGGSKNIIAIGSSTGGVEALRDIFLMLPENCPPIVMTQHMPEQFTTSLAARLNNLSKVRVSEAVSNDILKTGHAYLAPGGKHMEIKKSGNNFLCSIREGELVSGHRPSVDVLFNSVAEIAGNCAIGVILTGMGKDGAQGLLKMKNAGAYTIGQNESSCIVYGMPKAAAAIGAVDIELPLNEIVAKILSYCEKRNKLHA